MPRPRARASESPGRHPLSILFWTLLLLLGLGFTVAPEAAAPTRRAAILAVDGAIGPATSDYVARGLRRAAERGDAIIVIRLDTPGGLDTSMREIIRAMLASPVPVLIYVGPSGARAASAGTFMAYASHVSAMAPGTNLGAATPVSLGGGFPGPVNDDEPRDRDKAGGGGKSRPAEPRSAMEAKVVNDAVAYIRSLADLRGRNAEWAEKAVREGASLPAREALDLKVVDIVARDIDDLLTQAHGRRVTMPGGTVTLDTKDLTLENINPDWRTRFLAAITNPNVALILMMIGVYGLIFEFMHPGSLYPGTIGAIALLVGLYALAALPVNFAGLGLIGLGIALMIAEAFTPSLGALGIGGAISFAIGAAILIDTDTADFEVAWPVIGGIAVSGLLFSLVVGRLAVAARKHPVVTGREQMLGGRGRVLEWNGASGHVFVRGERWRAESRAAMKPGQRICVTGVNGLTLRVEPENADEDHTVHDGPTFTPRL